MKIVGVQIPTLVPVDKPAPNDVVLKLDLLP